MDVRECVVSAGRAVLDMVEREWQPLSAGELELRLDQAVEEVLEAGLGARLRPPPTFYVQFLQRPENVGHHAGPAETPAAPGPPRRGAAESRDTALDTLDTLDSAAVKHISDLLQSSKSRARMAGRARLSLSHTVLLSLTLLTERLSYRSVSRRFQLEKGNIHRIFFSFCERVNTLEEKQIRWPVGEEAAEALFPFSSLLDEEERDEGRGVPRVLGVLGHVRIPVRLPTGKHDVRSAAPEVKRTKKEARPDSWLNLELVSDRRGRFVHCRVSEGSDVDRGGALRDRLKRHPELLPSGCCLVAAAGYPLGAQLLTPYGGSPGPREELFNNTLEEHFQILRQAVADLRARFLRLRYLDIGDYGRARAVVLTACVLHNVFLDIGQVVRGEVEQEGGVTGEEEEEVVEEEVEVDEEGARRRDAVADLLLKNADSGKT